MNRTLAIHASDESFKLYKGTSTFGNLLFTQPEISQSGTYVWTVCLEDGEYVLEMTSINNYGWSENSIVVLSTDDKEIGSYQLKEKSKESIHFSIFSNTSYPVDYTTVDDDFECTKVDYNFLIFDLD